MTKFYFLFIAMMLTGFKMKQEGQYIARQGQITFFSYTPVENIEARNNQVLSLVDLSKNEIAVSMLMRAFVFPKSLMREHFNESYIESDLYPKATFEGYIQDYDPDLEIQTRIIKGDFTLRGISKEIEVMTEIERSGSELIFSGTFELLVEDFEINIPRLLARNIAESIEIKFNFEYEPNENP